MPKYENAIFDLDGTLLDTKDGIIKSLSFMSSNLKLPPIPECKNNLFIGPPIEQSVREYYGLDDQKTTEAAAMFRKVYAESYLFEAVLYDGILNTLSSLKNNGIRLAIATYKRHDYAKKIIEHFGLNEFCNPCLGSDSACRNTKTAIILACIMEMNADVSRTVYIGDTEHDRVGAKETNIDFIGVTYGFGYIKGNCSKDFANTPAEIAEIILGGACNVT